MAESSESTMRHHQAGWTEPNVVHQASGVIGARDHVTPAEALERLRRHTAVTGQPLVAVCAAIVARSISPTLNRPVAEAPDTPTAMPSRDAAAT